MAPECLVDRKYSSASDAWSFGVFSWEVFEHGKSPYPDMRADQVTVAVFRGYRLPRPQLCPDNMCDEIIQLKLNDLLTSHIATH